MNNINKQTDFHFFWNGPFSQWYLSEFEEFDEHFVTAEQFMMAAKAKSFGDDEIFEKIMTTTNPKRQKALGRQVRGFKPDTWNAIARKYVTLGNYNKFMQNDHLTHIIIEHRHKYFVEASPCDKVWGIGMRVGDRGIEDPTNWKGTNWLGESINAARDLLINDSQEQVEQLRSKLDWR